MVEQVAGTCAWAQPQLLPGAAPGGTLEVAAGDEPCGSGQGHFHPTSHRGPLTSAAFPMSGSAHRPFLGLHPPAWLLGWAGQELAKQMQRVGDT